MRTHRTYWLTCALIILLPASGFGYDPMEDEAAMKGVGLGSDGPALVRYFRNLILPKADEQKVVDLIKKLGDPEFDVRQQSADSIKALGPGAVPLLKQYVSNGDPEVAQRAQECLEHVRKSSTEDLVSAAARLIAHRNPPEAVTVLLQYAPFVKDNAVLEAFEESLTQLAGTQAKPNADLLKEITSEKENVRLLAKSALTLANVVDLETAKGFLKDTSPNVRLQVALTLVKREEKSAVEVLIYLLPDVALERAWTAEVVLYQLAGDHPPENAVLDDNVSTRKQARDVWLTWWKENAAKTQLADLKKRPPFLGRTLLAFQDNFGKGVVMEMDRNNNQLWSVDTLNFPLDAQVLPNNNVLIAEYGGRVAEWNVKTKKVVWEHNVANPISCQQLKNGLVLIAGLREIVLVDKKTKAVKMTYTDNQKRRVSNIYSARGMPNGEIVFVTNQGEVVRINQKGEEQHRFVAPGINNYCSIDVLPNNRILIPQYSTSQVAEYTLDGKMVWSASVRYPTSVFRLPNGNTLATSTGNRNVVELTRGERPRTVKAIPVGGTPWHVSRR